jgi:hypothetical protein
MCSSEAALLKQWGMPSKSQIKKWIRWGKKSNFPKFSYMLLTRDVFGALSPEGKVKDFYYPFYVRVGSEHREELLTANVVGVYPLIKGFGP